MPPQVVENHISGGSASFHAGKLRVVHQFVPELCIFLIVLSVWLFTGEPSLRQALVTHWCTSTHQETGSTMNHCGYMGHQYLWNE